MTGQDVAQEARKHIGEQGLTCAQLLIRVATTLGQFTQDDCANWRAREGLTLLNRLMDRQRFADMRPGDLLVAGTGNTPSQVGFLVSVNPHRIVHVDNRGVFEEGYPVFLNAFLLGVFRFKGVADGV